MESVLEIEVSFTQEKTSLSHYYVTPPLKILTLPAWEEIHPYYPLRVMQMSSSPGILADDEIIILIKINKNSGLILDTQAFTRVLSMDKDQQASQKIKIEVEENSYFRYCPHPLVLHKDAHFKQECSIFIQPNSKLFWSEIITTGRIHFDEHLDFNVFCSLTKIYYQNKLILKDNLYWNPKGYNLKSLGQLEQYTHFAVMYFMDTGKIFQQEWINQIYSIIESSGYDCHFGVSQFHESGMIIRAVSQETEPLMEMMRSIENMVKKK